ncbi:Glutamate decarboxylase and related PLP-dependent proteins [Aquiflexum balticum DSM 16537]|uniref:Glutamate decarboxylase and related PLP-dependent proteins n=1 Tax=Aquiflexum balticum DSM 16537 TaxID=758820 RepID=A0A1W2H4V0_9BACT|nr:pyridoxal-dependent decarboxylase [Aquiflexum balticum]SMD43965.1 Glutamate decarboxylase and related PLP-dependent proteins [Aquiflexum balticum DSM 16537]
MDINKKIEALRGQMALAKSNGTQSMGTWFLGPKGESHNLLKEMLEEALHHAIDGRESTYPNDPEWANTDSPEYKAESKVIMSNFKQLVRNLETYSVPFSSYRYQGHMLWDQSLPSVAGYFAAMLYNQNNVAAEASPLTTALEIEVANDLCHMVGYTDDGDIEPWGHITCDGSMANIEAMWSGRNTKLYPFAVLAAFIKEDELSKLSNLEVQLTGKNAPSKKILDMGWWELINLKREVILSIPTRLSQLAEKVGVDSTTLMNLIQKYTVQQLGLMGFANYMDELLEADGEFREALGNIKLVGPATMHYSLPKAATLIGLGSGAFTKIQIQSNARMDIDHLEKTVQEHFEKKIPIITVVAVMGTTEESAVDDLSGVLQLREKMRENGMEFFVHADGAWGGYFASMLNAPSEHSDAHHHLRKHSQLAQGNQSGDVHKENIGAAIAYQQLKNSSNNPRAHEMFMFTASTGLNTHTATQLARLKDADTITIDPHKSGFALYPAGSLVYKDHRMPQMIQITAPVVYHGGDAPTTGVFGVEGSKPGAAAAGVYFSHRIIKPDQSGYGRILGRCTFNTKRFFAQLMAIESEDFKLAALTDLKPEEIERIKEWTKLSNLELWERLSESKMEFDLFQRTGPDLNIISYALNPIINGKENKDPKVTNDFNNSLFLKLSNQSIDEPLPEVIVTSSTFDSENSSNAIRSLRNQLKIDQDDTLDMNFLITTVMNPWLSDTDQGKRNMIPEIVGYLQKAAEDLVHSKYK